MAVAFAVESTLGKLAKWLRILGFDTLFDSGGDGASFFRRAPADRLLLTRTRSVKKQMRSDRLIFIQANDPRQQLAEVIRCVPIRVEDVRPFTRCIACNRRIEPVEKGEIRNRVPDFVYQNHQHFQHCPRCRKIYWPGTHAGRVTERIRQLFDVAGQPAGEGR